MNSVRVLAIATLPFAVGLLSGCSGEPSSKDMQWVARDAWSQRCARKAVVETFEAEKKGWKVKDQVFLFDVKATFKLVDDCKGLPLVGKSYKAYESVKFEKKGLEMSKCKADGDSGWSLPSQEGKRCWTGPTSVGEEHLPKKPDAVLKGEESKKAGEKAEK